MQYRQEIRELKGELAEVSLLKNQDKAKQVKSEIGRLGKKFQLFFSPYVVDSVFVRGMQSPASGLKWNDPARYTLRTPKLVEEQGYLAELYAVMPEEYHGFMAMNTISFKKDVRINHGIIQLLVLGANYIFTYFAVQEGH